jgi:hypothetical protein
VSDELLLLQQQLEFAIQAHEEAVEAWERVFQVEDFEDAGILLADRADTATVLASTARALHRAYKSATSWRPHENS